MLHNPIKPDLAVVRVRHPLKFRLLQVSRIESVTSHLLRVTFTSEALHDFVSASFDDHIKVFFPEPGRDKPLLPTSTPDGWEFAEGERPISRDFTPRRYDRDARELDIEFAMHEAGPAAEWAAQARVGQFLGVGGPRGSMVIPTSFEWHLLIGDETALPAVARRLEELPVGTRVTAVLEVADESARIEFATQTDLHAVWRYRSGIEVRRGSGMLQAVREIEFPRGEGYVWAAGESETIKAVRQYLVGERGVHKSRIRAASYWKQGDVAVHETLDE